MIETFASPEPTGLADARRERLDDVGALRAHIALLRGSRHSALVFVTYWCTAQAFWGQLHTNLAPISGSAWIGSRLLLPNIARRFARVWFLKKAPGEYMGNKLSALALM